MGYRLAVVFWRITRHPTVKTVSQRQGYHGGLELQKVVCRFWVGCWVERYRWRPGGAGWSLATDPRHAPMRQCGQCTICTSQKS